MFAGALRSGIGVSIIDQRIFFIILVAWTALGAFLFIRLRPFSKQAMTAAPLRLGNLNPLHAIGVYVLYSLIFITALQAIRPVILPSKQEAPATSTTTTTTPATAASAPTSTATTTAPATSTASEGYDKTAWKIRAHAINVVVQFVCIGVMLLLASKAMRDGLRGFGLTNAQLPHGLNAGVLTHLAIMPFLIWVMVIVQAISDYLRGGAKAPQHDLITEFTQPDVSIATRAAVILAAVIMAPIFEELLFRGIMQTSLVQLFSRKKTTPESQGPQTQSPPARLAAMLVTSTLFTAIHFTSNTPNWEVFPPLFLLSMALGYIYERTGILWASITLHACFNATSLLMTQL